MSLSGFHLLLLFLLLYLLSTGTGNAQWPPDSAGMLKVHLDMRTTLSEGSRLRMGGASIGWEWGTKRNEATLGYYWTGKRGRADISRLSGPQSPLQSSPDNVETDIRFFSAAYWMTIRDWKRWKLSSPMEIGFGRARFTPLPDTGIPEAPYRSAIVPVQLAMYGEWKATRWVGVGIQTGYRHYFPTDQNVSLRSLNGLYYRFRVLLYIQTWYDWRDHLFKKQPLSSPFYQ